MTAADEAKRLLRDCLLDVCPDADPEDTWLIAQVDRVVDLIIEAAREAAP